MNTWLPRIPTCYPQCFTISQNSSVDIFIYNKTIGLQILTYMIPMFGKAIKYIFSATTSTTPSHPQEPIIPRYYPKCHCDKDNTGFICEQSGFEHPPQFKVVTSDILQDITGNYEEQFLVSTTDMYRLHRSVSNLFCFC